MFNAEVAGLRLSPRLFALGGIVLAAAVFRLLPAPVNFSPIAAMALFAGFTFEDRRAAFVFPMLAMLASDAIIGFHDLMWAVYLSFALIVLLGIAFRDQKAVYVKALTAVTGSLLFFAVTNFAVWAQSGMYPETAQGLVTCFIAALPFLDNALAGDLIFTGVFFGAWAAVERAWPATGATGSLSA